MPASANAIEKAKSGYYAEGVTIEPGGQGATYAHVDGFTVYGHRENPASSVLAGQVGRFYLGRYETLEAAQADFPGAEVIGGSSYAPPQLSHLPGDDDPDPTGESAAIAAELAGELG